MIEIDDNQARAATGAMAGAARAFVIDKDNPGLFAPVLDPALLIAGTTVELLTGGGTPAREFRDDDAQTVLNVILMPRVVGSRRAVLVRHECSHVEALWACGWNGKADWKVFQAMPAEYLANDNGRGYVEGMGYGAGGEFMVCALGATRDEMRDYLRWVRTTLGGYALRPAVVDDAVSVADSIVTSALAGAAPSRVTRVGMEALAAAGVAVPPPGARP